MRGLSHQVSIPQKTTPALGNSGQGTLNICNKPQRQCKCMRSHTSDPHTWETQNILLVFTDGTTKSGPLEVSIRIRVISPDQHSTNPGRDTFSISDLVHRWSHLSPASISPTKNQRTNSAYSLLPATALVEPRSPSPQGLRQMRVRQRLCWTNCWRSERDRISQSLICQSWGEAARLLGRPSSW